MNLIKPNQVCLELPQVLSVPAATYTTAGARQRAWLNQTCLEAFQRWLQAEFNLTVKVYPNDTALPSLWDVVNGTALTCDQTRLVLLPTVAITVDALEVPQEWVDLPAWAADYYVAMQVDPEQGLVLVHGYTTHQQLKTKGVYDAGDRTYVLDADDLWQDMHGWWLAQQLQAPATLRAALAPVPPLPLAQATSLLERLGNPAVIFPRHAVPFQQWAALLAHGGWRQALYERRQGMSDRGSVPQWLQTGVSGFAQQLGWQRQAFVLAAIGVRSQSLAAGIARSLVIADQPYELRVFALERSESSTWRVELRSTTSGSTIPVGFKLRLLTEDLQGMANNEDTATTAVERLYVDIVLEPGEGFVWEIEPTPEGYDHEILRC